MFHAELGEGETKTNEGLPTFSGSLSGAEQWKHPKLTEREREQVCLFVV